MSEGKRAPAADAAQISCNLKKFFAEYRAGRMMNTPLDSSCGPLGEKNITSQPQPNRKKQHNKPKETTHRYETNPTHSDTGRRVHRFSGT
jgi:hypothetical protein